MTENGKNPPKCMHCGQSIVPAKKGDSWEARFVKQEGRIFCDLDCAAEFERRVQH